MKYFFKKKKLPIFVAEFLAFFDLFGISKSGIIDIRLHTINYRTKKRVKIELFTALIILKEFQINRM